MKDEFDYQGRSKERYESNIKIVFYTLFIFIVCVIITWMFDILGIV
jgi:hypothetical protein